MAALGKIRTLCGRARFNRCRTLFLDLRQGDGGRWDQESAKDQGRNGSSHVHIVSRNRAVKNQKRGEENPLPRTLPRKNRSQKRWQAPKRLPSPV